MRKFGLAASTLLAFASFVPNEVPAEIIALECPSIGPFEEFGEDVDISFTYQISKTVNDIFEEFKVLNAETGKVYANYKKAQHTLDAKQDYIVSFTLKNSYYLSSDGLKLEFRIKTNNEILHESSGTIYPIERKTIYVYKQMTSTLKSRPLLLEIKNGNVVSSRDEFDFYNTYATYDSDLHYGLDLSPFGFLYNSKILKYESAQLFIEDKNNVFQNLKHSSGKVCLDLEINNTGKIMTFKYKKMLFVNSSSLDMSEYPMPGYVQTSDLFFPVNSKEKMIGSKIELVINGCGYNKYTLIFESKYDKSHSLIGNCHNSDYCIVGEIE